MVKTYNSNHSFEVIFVALLTTLNVYGDKRGELKEEFSYGLTLCLWQICLRNDKRLLKRYRTQKDFQHQIYIQGSWTEEEICRNTFQLRVRTCSLVKLKSSYTIEMSIQFELTEFSHLKQLFVDFQEQNVSSHKQYKQFYSHK